MDKADAASAGLALLPWPWPVSVVRPWRAPWKKVPVHDSPVHARFAEAWEIAAAGTALAARDLTLDLLQEARELPPAWNLLGCLNLELGDVAQAVAAFSVLVDLAGRDIRPHNNLAVSHHRGGRPDWAEAALRRALLLSPDHPVLMANLMMLLGDERRGELPQDRQHRQQMARRYLSGRG